MTHVGAALGSRRVLAGGALALGLAFWGGLVSEARSTEPVRSVCAVSTAERVVAIGDVHGGYERFQLILREAGLIDGRRRWTGGRAILVQTGDVLHRGAKSREVLDLLRKLERDAERAGGHVYFLLGNHEVSRMLGDMRDQSEGEDAAFRTANSDQLRERLYEILVADRRKEAKAAGVEFDASAFRATFLAEVPLGRIEIQQAFSAQGDYGKWLREHDAMAIINGVAYLHGGVSPSVAPLGCDGINAAIRAEIETVTLSDPNVTETMIFGTNGPLWYRGFFEDPLPTLEEIDATLAQLGARAMVVGHTVARGYRIAAHFGGRVYQIDTGLLGGDFYPRGVPSALEFDHGAATAVYEGQREPLPVGSGSVIQDRRFTIVRNPFLDQREQKVPSYQ